jgi:hypothetical protein
MNLLLFPGTLLVTCLFLKIMKDNPYAIENLLSRPKLIGDVGAGLATLVVSTGTAGEGFRVDVACQLA